MEAELETRSRYSENANKTMRKHDKVTQVGTTENDESKSDMVDIALYPMRRVDIQAAFILCIH